MAYYSVLSGMDDKALTPIVRSVNLMCALLDGVTYGTLYEEPFWSPSTDSGEPGDPNCALERIYKNANNLHDDLKSDPNGGYFAVDIHVKDLMTKIRGRLNTYGAPPAHLKGLFLRNLKAQSHPPEPDDFYLSKIHDHVYDLFTDRSIGNRLNHFCTPFMKHQTHGNSPVDAGPWGRFIGAFRDATLRQLFEERTKADYGKEVKEAKKHGILIDRSKTIPFVTISESGTEARYELMTPSGGNSKRCDGSGSACATSIPSHWCNLTASGECSAMSD